MLVENNKDLTTPSGPPMRCRKKKDSSNGIYKH